MTEIFLFIVNMSITASILAVVVLLLRLVLKKAPKWVSVLLWGLVALRLICPFAVESSFSLMPKTDWIEQKTLTEEDLFLDSVPDSIPVVDSSSLGKDVAVEYSYYPIENAEVEIHRGVSATFILSCVWIVGMVVLLLHTVISTVRLHRSISAAIRVRENIWESSAVDSPFVLGIIRPRIYVPRGMSDEKLTYVVTHEQAHIRRRDHWWKPLGFLLLTIHWFNPVMWLAYILLCRDIEMACDEKVVRDMGEAERADYSEALLECSVKRSMISACPLAFGEVGVKERIKTVLNYKKPAFWIVVLAVIACAVAAVCFLTNPPQNISIEAISRVTWNDMDVSEEYVQNLVSMIQESRCSYFPVGADDPNDLSVSVQIHCDDGSMYLLHYQYYSGFSFSPSHPGEDDYRSILTYFSPDGKGSKAWKLEYDFDAKFKKWLVAVRADPGIPYIPETDMQSGKQLTLDDVITLSAKGYDLTWEDFSEYSYTDVGSNLVRCLYEIDETFWLEITGENMQGSPMHIYLCSKAAYGDGADYVDIRGIEADEDAVEKFIERHTNSEITEEDSVETGYPTGEIQQPQIMLNGQVYFYFATGFNEPLPDGFDYVGSITSIDNINGPQEDFQGARVALEQEIYADKNTPTIVYLQYKNGFAKFECKEIKHLLTLDDVITLSAKGYDLTWEDFYEFKSFETGSGLYIRVYDIDETFSVWIGGSSPVTTPMYIYLSANDLDNRIDIRDGGVEEFIGQFRSSTLSDTAMLYERPISYYVDLAFEAAQLLADSDGITISKDKYNLRHDHAGKSIWVQFYGLTEEGWDDKFVDVALVQKEENGVYHVYEVDTGIKSTSEQIKATSLIVIGNYFESIEENMQANPSLANKDSLSKISAYDQMFLYGEKLVLEYIFTEFLTGKHDDLHGDVMMWVMLTLLNDNEIISYDAENGQDYFDHWLKSARSVGQQHDSAWLEDNVPAIALVLSMLEE